MWLAQYLRTRWGLFVIASVVALLGLWMSGGPGPGARSGGTAEVGESGGASRRGTVTAQEVVARCRERGVMVEMASGSGSAPDSGVASLASQSGGSAPSLVAPPDPEPVTHPGFPELREVPKVLGPVSQGVLGIRVRLNNMGPRKPGQAPLVHRAARGFAERFFFFANLCKDSEAAEAWQRAQQRRRAEAAVRRGPGSGTAPPAMVPVAPRALGRAPGRAPAGRAPAGAGLGRPRSAEMVAAELAVQAISSRRIALAYYQELAESQAFKRFEELPTALLEYAELLLTPGPSWPELMGPAPLPGREPGSLAPHGAAAPGSAVRTGQLGVGQPGRPRVPGSAVRTGQLGVGQPGRPRVPGSAGQPGMGQPGRPRVPGAAGQPGMAAPSRPTAPGRVGGPGAEVRPGHRGGTGGQGASSAGAFLRVVQGAPASSQGEPFRGVMAAPMAAPGVSPAKGGMAEPRRQPGLGRPAAPSLPPGPERGPGQSSYDLNRQLHAPPDAGQSQAGQSQAGQGQAGQGQAGQGQAGQGQAGQGRGRHERARALAALAQLVEDHPQAPEALEAAAFLVTTLEGAGRCARVTALVRRLPEQLDPALAGTSRAFFWAFALIQGVRCSLEEGKTEKAASMLQAVLAAGGLSSGEHVARADALKREAAALLFSTLDERVTLEEARDKLGVLGLHGWRFATARVVVRWVGHGRFGDAVALCEDRPDGVPSPPVSPRGALRSGAPGPGALRSGAPGPGALRSGAPGPGALRPPALLPDASPSNDPHPGAPRPGATHSGAPRPGATHPGAPRPGASQPGAPRPGASQRGLAP